jgi:deazaflavin-dependent oxidoreductase (nitroreductase family)
VVVASKGGIDRHPAWYLNLMANPETTAWWRGRKRRVRAREAEGSERERLWERMVEVYRPYSSYQRRTDRQIPVIVLEPVAE